MTTMSPAHQRPARASYAVRSRSTGIPVSTLWRGANYKPSITNKAANQQYLSPQEEQACVAVGRQWLYKETSFTNNSIDAVAFYALEGREMTYVRNTPFDDDDICQHGLHNPRQENSHVWPIPCWHFWSSVKPHNYSTLFVSRKELQITLVCSAVTARLIGQNNDHHCCEEKTCLARYGAIYVIIPE